MKILKILEKYLDVFSNIFGKVLIRHVPRKKKYIPGSNIPFMTKELSKSFMQRSSLNYKLLSYTPEENKSSHRNQINSGVPLLRKTKMKCFSSLKEKDITDNE